MEGQRSLLGGGGGGGGGNPWAPYPKNIYYIMQITKLCSDISRPAENKAVNELHMYEAIITSIRPHPQLSSHTHTTHTGSEDSSCCLLKQDVFNSSHSVGYKGQDVDLTSPQ